MGGHKHQKVEFGRQSQLIRVFQATPDLFYLSKGVKYYFLSIKLIVFEFSLRTTEDSVLR